MYETHVAVKHTHETRYVKRVAQAFEECIVLRELDNLVQHHFLIGVKNFRSENMEQKNI